MRPPRYGEYLVVAAALLAGCARQQPRPISLGAEPCAHCHMTIADPRFVAQAITTTGRAVVFDDVGCLAAWLAESRVHIRGAWVGSFVEAGRWLPADSAVYLAPAGFSTPMASGLIALRPGPEADSVRSLLGGDLLTWKQVRVAPHTHGLPSPG